ncbi:MAG: hypothetical protein ABMA26_06700 [Limisphaerales bacterium]
MKANLLSHVVPKATSEWWRILNWLRAGVAVGTVGGFSYIAVLYLSTLGTHDELELPLVAIVACVWVPVWQVAGIFGAAVLYVVCWLVSLLALALTPLKQ